jgi:DNA repair photolyase
MKREEFHASPQVRKNFFPQLEKDIPKHTARTPVLLCFTSDPYQPLAEETGATRRTIERLHCHDIPVTILTKGGKRSGADFDLLGPGDEYATTLTCVSDFEAAVWEPGAAPTWERIDALIAAKEKGLTTWVSFEPTIWPGQTKELLEIVSKYIDRCKVGPLNYANQLPADLRAEVPTDIDWAAFAAEFQASADRHGVEVYFKEDLRRLL